MRKRIYFILIILALAFLLFIIFSIVPEFFGAGIVSYKKREVIKEMIKKVVEHKLPPLDTVLYDKKMLVLANNPVPKVVVPKVPKTVKKVKAGKTAVSAVLPAPEPVPTPSPALKPTLWPVKTMYPLAGAILPFSRIVAYYGNLYSKGMGVLGQYSTDEMLSQLDVEVKKWKLADPSTPVIPALHYITVVAQGNAGADGKYRSRMPYSEIDKVLEIAKKVNAILFLDVQVGFSTLENELPLLEKYLKLPQVHLGIDPEFSMKGTIRPGKIVGTYDASDINYAIDFLAKIVKDNNLTPKILVVHRYTEKMVTNYKNIKPVPEVEVVMNMDGWGVKAKKLNTYKEFVYKQPVQFTGFKLFYKNDVLTPGTVLFTPEELLKLNPRPIYIQYQ